MAVEDGSSKLKWRPNHTGVKFRNGMLLMLVVCWLIPVPVSSVVQPSIPCRPGVTRLQLVKNYFYCGFLYKDILVLLFVIHNFKLSLRQLKRILKANDLRRRRQLTQENVVRQHILAEIENSGQCIGYRSMWQRLVKDHHLVVPRDSVLRIMREVNPIEVQARKAHRLIRRKYISRGPNYVWHVDGYDKLKPYGFAIHGAIDGFSRRILWLEVSISNNSPSVIAHYYLDTLKQLGVSPRLLRCDRGTENVRLAVLQPFFRYNNTDSLAGMKSFMYGKSTSNQRIESWWGHMRRQGMDWWIAYFKDLQDMNIFDSTNPVQLDCLRYCFMDLIQAELDRIAQHWNTHEIRQQRNANIPCGKPDILYYIPEMYGCLNFGNIVDVDNVKACTEMYAEPKRMYSEETKDLVQLLLPNHEMPACAQDALCLFRQILGEIDGYVRD